MDAALIVYALNLSAIYALMAIGISLLWSSIGMLNMAHGATFAVAGYGTLVIGNAVLPGIDSLFHGWAALGVIRLAVLLAAGVGVGALFGLVIYLLAFLPIHDKANFAVRGMIVTLAINLATVQTLLWWFGPRQQALPSVFGFGRLTLLGIPVRYDQAATIGATLRDSGYLIDPHTATAVKVAREQDPSVTPMIVLSTAHPAKFPAAVEQACGVAPALPAWLSDLMERQERFTVLPSDEKMLEDHVSRHTRAARTGRE